MFRITIFLIMLISIVIGCQNDLVPQVHKTEKDKGVLVEMTKEHIDAAKGIAQEQEQTQQSVDATYQELDHDE